MKGMIEVSARIVGSGSLAFSTSQDTSFTIPECDYVITQCNTMVINNVVVYSQKGICCRGYSALIPVLSSDKGIPSFETIRLQNSGTTLIAVKTSVEYKISYVCYKYDT